jgi:hypothetical protein
MMGVEVVPRQPSPARDDLVLCTRDLSPAGRLVRRPEQSTLVKDVRDARDTARE